MNRKKTSKQKKKPESTCYIWQLRRHEIKRHLADEQNASLRNDKSQLKQYITHRISNLQAQFLKDKLHSSTSGRERSTDFLNTNSDMLTAAPMRTASTVETTQLVERAVSFLFFAFEAAEVAESKSFFLLHALFNRMFAAEFNSIFITSSGPCPFKHCVKIIEVWQEYNCKLLKYSSLIF